MTAPRLHFELSTHLPHLLKHIYSLLQVASSNHLAGFGITVAIWRILAVLWEHGDLSHGELANLTSIEVSTLSRLSKGAERDGIIRRTRTRLDQRTVRVTLTAKGRALTRNIIPAALLHQARILESLSHDDIETLTRLLRLVVGNLNRHTRAARLPRQTVPSAIVDGATASCDDPVVTS